MFNFEKYNEIANIIREKGRKTQIIAISKNHPVLKIEEAIAKNIRVFGENRVQEAKQKFETIKSTNSSIELHLTGPLQTNKVKQALNIFDVFHTVDRESLLKELGKFPERLTKKSFFIQVNTGKEETKSGVYPEKIDSFLKLCENYGLKNIKGLMCIPPINESPTKHFQMIDSLRKQFGLSGLSIGMSSDYLEALQFNPTYIRLGTILFGSR